MLYFNFYRNRIVTIPVANRTEKNKFMEKQKIKADYKNVLLSRVQLFRTMQNVPVSFIGRVIDADGMMSYGLVD